MPPPDGLPPCLSYSRKYGIVVARAMYAQLMKRMYAPVLLGKFGCIGPF